MNRRVIRQKKSSWIVGRKQWAKSNMGKPGKVWTWGSEGNWEGHGKDREGVSVGQWGKLGRSMKQHLYITWPCSSYLPWLKTEGNWEEGGEGRGRGKEMEDGEERGQGDGEEEGQGMGQGKREIGDKWSISAFFVKDNCQCFTFIITIQSNLAWRPSLSGILNERKFQRQEASFKWNRQHPKQPNTRFQITIMLLGQSGWEQLRSELPIVQFWTWLSGVWASYWAKSFENTRQVMLDLSNSESLYRCILTWREH